MPIVEKTSGGSPLIEVSHFSKTYGQLLAVDNLSFCVDAGQILGLIGRNGAGKTTTIRSLAGIVNPSSGEIRICDQSIFTNPLSAKRQLAYVPDEPQLFDALTVREHLEFIRMSYRMPRCTHVMRQLLHEFELSEKEHVPAEELSRGMRQKLGLCCAFLHEPQVLLLDEPMVGLDPHGIRQLKSTIVDRSLSGAAIVISSHMLAMVEDICTHLLVLNDGQAKFFGTIVEMQRQFGSQNDDVSLENAFFRAISNCNPAAIAVNVESPCLANVTNS